MMRHIKIVECELVNSSAYHKRGEENKETFFSSWNGVMSLFLLDSWMASFITHPGNSIMEPKKNPNQPNYLT